LEPGDSDVRDHARPTGPPARGVHVTRTEVRGDPFGALRVTANMTRPLPSARALVMRPGRGMGAGVTVTGAVTGELPEALAAIAVTW
jgi:hypothetical protein